MQSYLLFWFLSVRFDFSKWKKAQNLNRRQKAAHNIDVQEWKCILKGVGFLLVFTVIGIDETHWFFSIICFKNGYPDVWSEINLSI